MAQSVEAMTLYSKAQKPKSSSSKQLQSLQDDIISTLFSEFSPVIREHSPELECNSPHKKAGRIFE